MGTTARCGRARSGIPGSSGPLGAGGGRVGCAGYVRVHAQSGLVLGAAAGPPSLSWDVDEVAVYKDKGFLSLSVPDISAGAQSFWNELKNEVSAIDRSPGDTLTKWIDVARAMLGDHRSVVSAPDANIQGLIRLDRVLAKLLAKKGEKHPAFSVKFAGYITLCHGKNRSPKGRVR